LKRKVVNFLSDDFAAYLINHVMHEAAEKIREDNTPGRKTRPILTEHRIRQRKKIKGHPISAPQP
jgi:hypothetical protein